MKHQMSVSGAENDQTIIVTVDETDTEFDLTRDIKAQEIFDLMQFSRGDSYEFNKGDRKTVNASSFDAFASLLENICTKANELHKEDLPQLEDATQPERG